MSKPSISCANTDGENTADFSKYLLHCKWRIQHPGYTGLRWLEGQACFCSSPYVLADDQESFKLQHPRRVAKTPTLALVLDKCQYMGHLGAGLQHSALHVSNIRPRRNYIRTVLIHCDDHMIFSVNQQINEPALSTIRLTKLDNSGNGTSTFLDVAFYMHMSILGMVVFHLHDCSA